MVASASRFKPGSPPSTRHLLEMTLDTLIHPDWANVLRKKLLWLEGFAGALDNRFLNTWVDNFRADLNKMEAGEVPVYHADDRRKKKRESYKQAKNKEYARQYGAEDPN